MEYVPDAITPLEPRDACSALRQAVFRICREYPSVECLAVLLAQSALETGHWKAIHRWNFGNAKVSKNWKGNYTCFRCNEVIGGKVLWFSPAGAEMPKGNIVVPLFDTPPGHPQTRFRAFVNATDGAEDHLHLLTYSPRYADAWMQAWQGHPGQFVEELGRAGYFTADRDTYKRAVLSLFSKYLPVARDTHDAPIELDSGSEDQLCRDMAGCARIEIPWLDIRLTDEDWAEMAEARRKAVLDSE